MRRVFPKMTAEGKTRVSEETAVFYGVKVLDVLRTWRPKPFTQKTLTTKYSTFQAAYHFQQAPLPQQATILGESCGPTHTEKKLRVAVFYRIEKLDRVPEFGPWPKIEGKWSPSSRTVTKHPTGEPKHHGYQYPRGGTYKRNSRANQNSSHTTRQPTTSSQTNAHTKT